MERVHVATGRTVYRDMTKFWGKLFGINFALGSHLHVELNGRYSVFPFHGAKEIPAPLANAIKKDLGLK